MYRQSKDPVSTEKCMQCKKPTDDVYFPISPRKGGKFLIPLCATCQLLTHSGAMKEWGRKQKAKLNDQRRAERYEALRKAGSQTTLGNVEDDDDSF
jgi:hypothetical protein